VDRASWPALILFVPLTCPPEPRSPPVHPHLQAEERSRVCKLLSPEHPWLVSSLESPPLSPWPHSQERGACCREPWRPPPAIPGCPSEEPQTSPASAAVPENPGTNTGPGSTPKRGRRAVPTAPTLSWPFGLGAALLLFPRDLSYTGARGSPPPLQEVPFLCPTPGQAGRRLGPGPPCWFLDGPCVGSKK